MSGFQPNNDMTLWGRIATKIGDAINFSLTGLAPILRTSPYGDLTHRDVGRKADGVAGQGSYHVTRTQVVEAGPSTIAALNAFVDTSPLLVLSNSNPVGGADIHLDFIKITVLVAGATGTNLRWASKIDRAPRAAPGAGVATTLNASTFTGAGILTGGPTRTDAPAGLSGLQAYFGPLIAPASSPAAVVLDSGPIRSSIMVANDQLLWSFGGTEKNMSDLAIATATAIQKTIPHPPVCLAPQTSFSLYLFAAAQSGAASLEMCMGHVER